MQLPDLTRQQRNMARLAPLMRLEQQKHVALRSVPDAIRERIDIELTDSGLPERQQRVISGVGQTLPTH